MQKRIITCCLLLLSMVAVLPAQSLLRPEEAVSAALSNNYGILLARNDSGAAAIELRYVNAAFLPRLNAVVGTNWNNNDQRQTFTDGNVRERDGVRSNILTGALQLNWTLFDGMRMFIVKERTEEAARLGEWTVKEQVVNTVAEVLVTYYDIVRQQQQLKAITEQMAVNEERVKVADRKLQAGLGSKPELLQARVDLNAQQAIRLRQLTLIAQRKAQLNQLAGMQLPETFEVVEDIPFDTGLELEQLLAESGGNNPSLLLSQRQIGIAQLRLREEKAMRYPTLSFQSAYNFNRTDNQTVVNPFQPLTSRLNGMNLGLTANIPILNNRQVERNIEQATRDIQFRQLTYTDQSTRLVTNLRNTYADYTYQMEALVLEEQNIELARENVTIALERFRQGVSTYLELREAQKSLEEAYNRLIAARYNAKLAETELLRLTGAWVR
jgi:outer membrane protein TolC